MKIGFLLFNDIITYYSMKLPWLFFFFISFFSFLFFLSSTWHGYEVTFFFLVVYLYIYLFILFLIY